MNEFIDSLGYAMVFSTLDFNQGYWKVEMVPDDLDKATFTSCDGLFRLWRIPFGLKNALGTYQRVIDIIMSTARWKYALVYLDAIVLSSTPPSHHFSHVRKVLTLLLSAGMTLLFTNVFFIRSFIDYLVHVNYPVKLSVANRTLNAISGMKSSGTSTHLRLFFGPLQRIQSLRTQLCAYGEFINGQAP